MQHLKFKLIISFTKKIFVCAWCKSNHSTARSKWTKNDFRSLFELTELLCNLFFAKRTSKDHSVEVMVIFSFSFILPRKILHLHQELINITLHLPATLLFVFMWCRQDLKTQTVATKIFFWKILPTGGTNLKGKFHVDILRRFRRKTLRMRTRSYQRIVLEINWGKYWKPTNTVGKNAHSTIDLSHEVRCSA